MGAFAVPRGPWNSSVEFTALSGSLGSPYAAFRDRREAPDSHIHQRLRTRRHLPHMSRSIQEGLQRFSDSGRPLLETIQMLYRLRRASRAHSNIGSSPFQFASRRRNEWAIAYELPSFHFTTWRSLGTPCQRLVLRSPPRDPH